MSLLIPVFTRPGRTIAPHIRWFSPTTVCPGSARRALIGGQSYGRMALSFNGGTPSGGICAGTPDPRVVITSGALLSGNPCGQPSIAATFSIDLWGAWAAGEWTSSVAVTIATCSDVTQTAYITACLAFNNSLTYANHACKTFTTRPPFVSCPTTIVAVVTYYEDGSYTVT